MEREAQTAPGELWIVEGNWGAEAEDGGTWLKVGFAWFSEADAQRDADHRAKNRPGVKFRVGPAQTVRATTSEVA